MSGLRYRPLYVMPQLIVESVSRGYESHDRVTKRDWYAINRDTGGFAST